MKKKFKNWLSLFSLSSFYSDDKGLIVPAKQLNWLISGLLFFGLSSFVAGYFWGQRKAVEYFIKRIEEDSFADRISYALYTMNDRDSLEFSEPELTDISQSADTDDDAGSENADNGSETSDDAQESNDSSDSNDDLQIITQDTLKNADSSTEFQEILPAEILEVSTFPEQKIVLEKTVYLARLAGFGTLQAACLFLDRVKVLDKGACVVEHVSKTSKGRKMKWYQVVTSKFDDRKTLNHLVDRIKQKEHISGVQIIDQKKGC